MSGQEFGDGDRSRAALARRLQQASGALTTSTLTRMERDMPWFRQLSAEDRSWIGLIVQAGINAFVTWYGDPGDRPITAEVFGAAPRALTGVVSLHQTVEMVRLTIEVVEENVVEAVGEQDAASVRDAITRYAREVAFATAEVYAQAAEMRGAWDARLEALVVDSVLRAEADETVRSRASALGWEAKGDVVVVLGRVPEASRQGREGIIDEVRRSARQVGLDALCAVQGDRLVVVLGGVDNPDKARRFGRGALRARAGRGRPAGRRPGERERVRARRRGRPARRARLAAGAPAGERRRPAARARAGRGRGTPGGSWCRRSTGRCWRPVRRPWRRSRPTSTTAARSRARRGRCSCTRTPCATGCAASPSSPG